MTLLTLSCVPTHESTSHLYESDNIILLGFWHGIIIPFSALGKLLGLNIGIYQAGNLSYWFGFGFAIYLYIRIIHFIWVHIELDRQ